MAIATLCLTLLLAAPPANEERGYIGIQPAPLNAELRKMHKVADNVEGGLVLVVVHEKTAAAKAGLRVGDVLTRFDEKPVNSIEELLKLLETKKAGDKVTYVARRGTGTIAGTLVLGKRPQPREVIIEEPIAEAKAEDEMEARVKALQAEMETLRRRALQKQEEARRKAAQAERKAERRKATPAPRSLKDWMAREEEALVQAEREKKVEKIIWHRARLQLLREMSRSGLPRANTNQRVVKLEKRLQEVLRRLERLEAEMK
ncbi:MAG: PDZ domain-containing protein [Planctomycetota bacterium]|jgi:hypothetical protein